VAGDHEAALATRLYQPGDEEAVYACMRVCFGFDPDPARWRHLHLDNPAGPSIYPLVWDGTRVVSGVAFVPRRVVAFGREDVVRHSHDSMTLPEYRGQGIRSAASEVGRRLARERGSLAVFSFANEASLPGVLRHPGRRAVADLPLMVRPLRPVRAALTVAATSGPLKRLALARAQPEPPESAAAGPIPDGAHLALAAAGSRPGWSPPAFDERHTRLFRSAEGLPEIALLRDAAHLRWRYAEAPGRPYVQYDVVRGDTLAASVVVRTTELQGMRLALVMEWAWRPGAHREGIAALREAVRLGRAAGAHVVSALAMPGTRHRRLLGRLGFIGVPRWLAPKRVIFNVAPEVSDTDATRWYCASSWHLTWGDGTLV
jgi:hypothetical protein